MRRQAVKHGAHRRHGFRFQHFFLFFLGGNFQINARTQWNIYTSYTCSKTLSFPTFSLFFAHPPNYMWKSEAFRNIHITYRAQGDIIVLNTLGATSQETYPYHEVALEWHKRSRAMFPCPQTILATYLPLASATFHKFRDPTALGTADDKKILVLGDNGLNFALNDRRQPSISIEAAALFQLVNTLQNLSPLEPPTWLQTLQNTWTHSMCLFMFNTANGFRGIFAEHRFWAALLLHKQQDKKGLKTPYSVPLIRSWCHTAILDDFTACVGDDVAMRIAQAVAQQNFDGAPDLLLYSPNTTVIWMVEVKSSTDTLKPKQLAMLQALSCLPYVSCQICCPQSVKAKFANYQLDPRDTDTENSD